MVLLSANIALIIFATILVISAVIAWKMNTYEYYDKSTFHTFISILAGLGVFVTFMFYYNIVVLQNDQQTFATVSELARINDSVINSLLIDMQKSSVIIPNFILSITPLTNTVCCNGITGTCEIPVEPDPVNPQTCTEKMALSYRIFNLWQDIVLSYDLMNYDILGYITNFLQRANSSQLFEQWYVGKINFEAKTQQLGDLLFEYGLPITIQTPEEYVKVANNLIADPRFNEIFT
jgi:hypothetical protein